MEQVSNLRARLNTTTLDDLLTRLARDHQRIPRLIAVADTDYPKGSKMHLYLTAYYKEMGALNEDLTDFMELLQDSWAATSTSGKLSYNEKVRRRDRLNVEIAGYEARGKIVSFTDYKARKEFQSAEPPEAA